MITAQNLVKIYPDNIKALDGISFNVGRGEVCGYIGANGAGKSTTIKILCGMMAPSSGTAAIAGLNVAEHPTEVKRKIGYVPESAALFLSLSPYDYLEFVCRMYDIDKNEYDRRIHSFMELFDLKNEVRTPMHTFSKGMKQKVLIISSLIHNPEVIFWDEPLSGIDYSTTTLIRSLVKELSEDGKTFFYSTHLIESVDKMCTKVIVLNSGKIVYDESMNNTSNQNITEVIKKYIDNGQVSEKIAGLYKNLSS